MVKIDNVINSNWLHFALPFNFFLYNRICNSNSNSDISLFHRQVELEIVTWNKLLYVLHIATTSYYSL